MSESDGVGIDQLRESPEKYCIRVATGWGTVFIRWRADRLQWSKTVWMPDESAGDGRWYESRVYSDERSELLEHEYSVYPMARHPLVDGDET